MSQFVGDRMGEHDAIVLVDAAGLLRLAHPAHIGQAKGPVGMEESMRILAPRFHPPKPPTRTTHMQLLAQMFFRVIRIATSW